MVIIGGSEDHLHNGEAAPRACLSADMQVPHGFYPGQAPQEDPLGQTRDCKNGIDIGKRSDQRRVPFLGNPEDFSLRYVRRATRAIGSAAMMSPMFPRRATAIIGPLSTDHLTAKYRRIKPPAARHRTTARWARWRRRSIAYRQTESTPRVVKAARGRAWIGAIINGIGQLRSGLPASRPPGDFPADARIARCATSASRAYVAAAAPPEPSNIRCPRPGARRNSHRRRRQRNPPIGASPKQRTYLPSAPGASRRSSPAK